MLGWEVRERRMRRARRSARRRAGLSVALALLLHLFVLPLFVGIFDFEGRSSRDAPPVEMVRVPAAAWDAALAQAERAAGRDPLDPTPRRPPSDLPQPERQVEKREEAKKEPEKAPGQVVEVAPGNGEEDPSARFASERANRVKRETIARDRRAGEPVTLPRRTTNERPVEIQGDETEGGEGKMALAWGETSGDPGDGSSAGRTRVEIPRQQRRDGIDLPEDRPGDGALARRSAADEIVGNSNRLRIEIGRGEEEGDGDGAGASGGGGLAGGLRLFPSGAALDRIVGGPAPDHVEGVEEGVETFLNTREWKYASFFNRVKSSVARNWDPLAVLRVRDPTGNVYAWRERVTVLSIVLREDGSIADMWVEQSSGVDFLDREAMAAFERAQPFPHPPSGMMDESGRIHFHFGFHVGQQQPLRFYRRY